MENISFKPIGIIHSPFKEKFGTPRQFGIVRGATGIIELSTEYGSIDTVRELEHFSHLWIIFVFNQHLENKFSPIVRPPRRGGNTKVGVYASRSPYRPNPIGLSCVELIKIEKKNSKVLLHVGGIDMIDQTPILDIKPYIKNNDAIENANNGWIDQLKNQSKKLEVTFLKEVANTLNEDDQTLIKEILQLNPWPAYKDITEESYAFKFKEHDVHFTIKDDVITVSKLTKL